MLQPYLQIGVITSTHALRGEVKVYPTTDDVRRFEDLTEVYAASDPEHAG
ncbi:MAG TPA: 16S rRNA processing protein RimM, partial [Lachnospiraceae bacterium]|nr:16S rRNA processing protein RimM [Lachnospiraceae bacterium]